MSTPKHILERVKNGESGIADFTRTWDLRGNKIDITPEQVLELAEIISKSSSLRRIALERIPDHAVELGKALETNKSIEDIRLENTQLGPEFAQVIVKMLKVTETLYYLSLKGNRIGDEAGAAIIEALAANKTVKFLYLDSNMLRQKTLQAVAKMLRENTTLTMISLGHNSLDGGQVEGMIEALKSNTSLTHVVLTGNCITDVRNKFAEMLRANRTLRSIYLDKNLLGPDAVSAIFDALQVNETVTGFNLCFNDFNDDIEKFQFQWRINKLTDRNRKIQDIQQATATQATAREQQARDLFSSPALLAALERAFPGKDKKEVGELGQTAHLGGKSKPSSGDSKSDAEDAALLQMPSKSFLQAPAGDPALAQKGMNLDEKRDAIPSGLSLKEDHQLEKTRSSTVGLWVYKF